jgi:magnesium transporter
MSDAAPLKPASAAAAAAHAVDVLSDEVSHQDPSQAAEMLSGQSNGLIADVLETVNPDTARDILDAFPEDRQKAVLAEVSAARSKQWDVNETYPEGSVGRLMDPPVGVFPPEADVARVVGELRELVKGAFITYAFIVDAGQRLLGVVVMRDMLLADPATPMGSLMLKNPFSLRPETDVMEAMRAVLHRHYPVYPVCDDSGRLVGLVRGQVLFETQAFEISAQAGAMVGVEKEERLSTPWSRSLAFRHPWLQLNLLTAFVAAGVVGWFQDTIDAVVVLAVFLPVLAGQSGNTGCQALAVTLRGMTLGELKPGRERALVMKEGLLGLTNGALVGISAGLGMLVVASLQGNPAAKMLAFVVFLAMIGSCVVSGLSGALIPLTLKRLGADPATASSIFLTTATDVASMGLFLGLASWLVL